jgi:hypothetical protein
METSARPDAPASRAETWRAAIPVAIVSSLVAWVLFHFRLEPGKLAGPVAAAAILVFLHRASRGGEAAVPTSRLVAGLAGLAGFAAYAIALGRSNAQYGTLATVHLPAVAWVILGWTVLGARAGAEDRFAAIRKSIEVVAAGGLFGIASAVFMMITVNMFDIIDIVLPKPAMNWIVAGIPGLVPVIAVATVYDPSRAPSGQASDRGIARLLTTVFRVFVPLTLLVLVVYVASIPFNFRKAFDDRSALMVYNMMLFAVMALVAGAAPHPHEAGRALRWLRWGLTAVAALAAIVGLYALVAVGSRTAAGGFTPNRIAVIGWNVVNIGVLAAFLARSLAPGSDWKAALRSSFSLGAIGYSVWAALVVLALAWVPTP